MAKKGKYLVKQLVLVIAWSCVQLMINLTSGEQGAFRFAKPLDKKNLAPSITTSQVYC